MPERWQDEEAEGYQVGSAGQRSRPGQSAKAPAPEVAIEGQQAGPLHRQHDWHLGPIGLQGVGQSLPDENGPCGPNGGCQEVRKGKKPPEVLIDSLGREGGTFTQLLKAIQNSLAVKPKMAGTTDMLGPKKGLPSGEQLRAGSGLDDAREAVSTDRPEVKGISKNEGPAGLGEVGMGSRMTRAISEKMKLIREGRRWQIVRQAKRGQPSRPKRRQRGCSQRDKAPPKMRGPLKPVRGKGSTAALSSRTGLKAMGITVRSPTVSAKPCVREMAGVFPRVESANDDFAN